MFQRDIELMDGFGSPIKGGTNADASPLTSPSKYRTDGGDRYIPFRQNNDDWSARYSAISHQRFQRLTENGPRRNCGGGGGGPAPPVSNSSPAPTVPTIPDDAKQESFAHRALLRNELLRDNISDIRGEYDTLDYQRFYQTPGQGLFQYGPKRSPLKFGEPSTSTVSSSPSKVNYTNSPLSEESQRLLKSPRKPQRKVPKNPYKVLDAPELQDDFYLNLVDWSAENMLAVGLNTCVYLWSACNSQVIKLCDLQPHSDTVTSVQWSDNGDYLAVGTNQGKTQIWDMRAQKRLHDLSGHTARIGCLSWNGDLICSGSRDRYIFQRDIRCPDSSIRRLGAHKQEVCGLKWSHDKNYLASGGNDNQLLVWNLKKDEPFQTYSEHNAAVKALAWSPHHHGLLVSGGGTADRCLRFWNTLTGQPMQCIDTGSQVCNVAWSKHSSELVSTHGYSLNQVIIWKYPALQPITKLTGHQFRVLYLAMSPDGESIVTGAGDETLRFWHVFSKSGQPKAIRSKLNLFTSIR
uniref:Fizzy-related protein homolog n=1 Tax=Steinernema glaseri TaxID=37863 RepID=A0A1I7ZQS6_9BILA